MVQNGDITSRDVELVRLAIEYYKLLQKGMIDEEKVVNYGNLTCWFSTFIQKNDNFGDMPIHDESKGETFNDAMNTYIEELIKKCKIDMIKVLGKDNNGEK